MSGLNPDVPKFYFVRTKGGAIFPYFKEGIALAMADDCDRLYPNCAPCRVFAVDVNAETVQEVERESYSLHRDSPYPDAKERNVTKPMDMMNPYPSFTRG